jgi:multisubunit Na+/H+ antiporter MnhG subunit
MALMHLIIAGLLACAVLIALFSCLGVLVMKDAYQRLQFCSVVAAFCPLLIGAAVWLDHPAPAARIKVVLIGAILIVMNSVLATATAKAARIREVSRWEPHADEKIPIVGRHALAGQGGAAPENKA